MTHLENPSFLKKKYNLHNALEVERAVKCAEKKTGKKIPRENAVERIQCYLDRLEQVINPKKLEGHPNFDRKLRNLAFLKRMLYEREVIKPDEVPESYFETIRQRHREEGYGEVDISSELRQQIIEPVIEDQKNSLDIWVDYLASEDAKYPDYLKYWAFRSILKMGRYDKEKKKFTERYSGTVSPFPELNREALALVVDAMEKREQRGEIEFGYDIEEETKSRFLKELDYKNFSKLYGIAIEEFRPISEELLKITEGEWRTFPQGTDSELLVQTLKNHGTGWCIRGKSTAKRYLDTNDLEVFYSNDEEGNPTVPRVVIVSSKGRIFEVRGIEKQENLDPYIGEVVHEKLRTLPDGKSFQKKEDDMRRLTEISKKHKQNQLLTKEDLLFFYEIDSTIEGFGYQRDPRIKEIRSRRNVQEDMLVIFECTLDQIAHEPNEINENTKAYIGEWNIDIFETVRLYPNITHLYESFPDEKIFMQTLKTDPKIYFPEKAKQELDDRNIYISPLGKDILKKTEFSKKRQTYELVAFTVSQLGFPEGATTEEIYRKALERGLKLCPAEVGPYLRLQNSEKMWRLIAMEPIADRDGDPGLFFLYWDDVQLVLSGISVKPSLRWSPDAYFVFRSRKLET